MSESDWTFPTDTFGYMQGQKKTLDMEKRRPRVTKASDLLGPSLGPFAIEIDNLDGDAGAFNGMWVAAPGTLETPDEDLWFAGYTIASEINGGYQYATTYLPTDAPHRAFERGWRVVPGTGTRAYSDWVEIGAVTQVFAEYQQANAQGITDTNITKLLDWSAVSTDPAFSIVGGDFTCNIAGVYNVSVMIALTSGAGNTRLGYIYLNNSLARTNVTAPSSSSATSRVEVNRSFRLAVGDVLDFRIWQNSGSTLDTLPGVPTQVTIAGA